MSGLAFLKKEFKEITKTYKIWVVPIIFLFFGFLSPIAAKVLPEILKPQLESQKIFIEIPPPTAADSFLQFFKNLAQMGMLAIILLSMGLVSEEKARGTFSLVLTKPISRTAVILSKFFAQKTLILASITIGGIVCYIYTLVLFKTANLSEFALAALLYLIYSLLIIAITLFFSTLFYNQIAAGGLSLLAFFTLSLLPSLSESFARYSPGAIPSLANKIVSEQAAFSKSSWPIAVSLLLVVVLLALSCLSFNRQEL